MIMAFCDQKKERKEYELGYWNKKHICKKFVDMVD
jgi:hypothetical protein